MPGPRMSRRVSVDRNLPVINRQQINFNSSFKTGLRKSGRRSAGTAKKVCRYKFLHLASYSSVSLLNRALKLPISPPSRIFAAITSAFSVKHLRP